MNRANQIQQAKTVPEWDLIVIGGGASGLGTALDAVSRGLKTIVVEKYDFGKGTSSKSTKLIHGGVRYLEQGNIRLVREALAERSYILDKAGHNAHIQPFIIPFYSIFRGLLYFIGLKMYDLLAGSRSIGKTEWLNKNKTSEYLPALKKKGLKGGILYFDGQFDDARMCIDLVKTIIAREGSCINYFAMKSFIKENGKITGISALDTETGESYNLYGKNVVNATGVFANNIVKKDDVLALDLIIPSRGSHIVIDRSFLKSNHAIMVPKTTDGRVLFIIPWLDKVIIGTTDVKTNDFELEPKVRPEEIDFILNNAAIYLSKAPTMKDILAVYAGLRPLAAPKKGKSKTKEISRGHKIIEAPSGLVSIIGGKWTTFRKMGEDVINHISKNQKSSFKPSSSSTITLVKSELDQHKLLDEDGKIQKKAIHYFINEEMAVRIEDILARRTRNMFLDASLTETLIETVGEIMKQELNWNQAKINNEIETCRKLVTQYKVPLIQ